MRRVGSVAVLLLIGMLMPRIAEARGYGKGGGTVMTPFGPLYNTNSPEWRASGGNIFMYEGIMEQEMLIRQQQMMLKLQQQMARQQRSNAKASTAHQPQPRAALPVRPRRKKRHTLKGSSNGTAKAAASANAGESPAPTAPAAGSPPASKTGSPR